MGVKRLEDAISDQMGLFDTYESEEKAQEDIILDIYKGGYTSTDSPKQLSILNSTSGLAVKRV